MNVIKVNSEKCTGCKTCYKACWIDVIRWDESAKRPIIAYPEDCVECNYCEISCPVDALTVVVDYGRPWPSVYE